MSAPDDQHDAEQSIDDILDRAIEALNRGDRTTAADLAEQVLAVDSTNSDAEDLLAAPTSGGEMRRLTIFFADLVDSTVLSTRIDPETYRTVVGRYREHVLRIVERYEGHIGSTKGDGLLAVFGHPLAHENDAKRAVQAGLEITRAVAALSEQTQHRFGFTVAVRVGVHRGVVYLDTAQDDVYGLAANFAARVSGLAPPGTTVVSGAIEPLLRRDYELEALPPQSVKGIEGLVEHHRVVAEKPDRPRTAQGPLIGRQRELDEFERIWKETVANTPTTPGLGFLGEPGLGKSRLATTLADTVEQSGGTVIALFGSPFHTDAGLHPVRTLLERRSGIGRATVKDDRLSLLKAELASCALDPDELVPLLAPVMGLTASTGYERASSDGHKLHQRISAAVCDYLVACLGDAPGLILIEDLQWFDKSTRDVIEEVLARRLPHVLLLLTARDGSHLPDAVTAMPLAPLTDAETNDLIAAVDPSLSDANRLEVRRRCDGVPLYIEEVVAKLARQQNETVRRPSPQWERVPDALYEPLFAQLRSSDNAVPVVVAAATIGREVDRTMLMSVLALGQDEFDTVIAELEHARVFEPVGADAWRFRHELLREVAAELPPPSQRQLLHGRIAATLLETSGGQPDWREVALHFGLAERHDEAAKAYQKASSDARGRGALAEARDYLTRAVDHVGRMEPGPKRDRREINTRLQRGFIVSAAEATTSPDAAADFERCLELVGNKTNDEMLATLTALYPYYLTRCDLRRASQLLESVGAALDDTRAWFRPVNQSGFGQIAWFRGQFGTARKQLEDCAAAGAILSAVDLERNWFMPHEPVAGIHTNLALARFIDGDYAGMAASLTDTENRCNQLSFPHGPFTQSYARQLEAWMRAEAGQFEIATAVAEEMAESAERYGFDGWLMVSVTMRAVVSALATLSTETVDEAAVRTNLAELRSSVKTLEAVHLVTYLTMFETVTAKLFLALGDTARARKRIASGLAQADQTGLDFYRAELLRHRAKTWPDSARRDADLSAALELARRQGAKIFALRAAVDHVDAYGEPALTVLAETIGAFAADSTWPELAPARALLG